MMNGRGVKMQNQATAKKAKAKRPLVFKPYLKGNVFDGTAMKRALRLMAYFLMFAFLYLMVGSALQLGNAFLRTVMNLLMVLVCAAILYMDGARLGEAEVAFGEIAYGRQQSGRDVEEKDRERCFHPLKGVVIALVAAVPLLLLTIPNALTAEKQVYTLQSLPKWVSGYGSQAEIPAPLSYYSRQVSVTVMDVVHMISRILIFPFANIATVDNKDALLLMDRLSPLLSCLPLLGFPLGYLTGPRSRALVHGDISSSNKRQQRRFCFLEVLFGHARGGKKRIKGCHALLVGIIVGDYIRIVDVFQRLQLVYFQHFFKRGSGNHRKLSARLFASSVWYPGQRTGSWQ